MDQLALGLELSRVSWIPCQFHSNDGQYFIVILVLSEGQGRSHWPRRLRRRSAAARLLRSWVRIPPGAWMDVCCECCVLSGRGLCDELITRPEESYQLWCVVVCDIENLKNEEAMTRAGSQRHRKKNHKDKRAKNVNLQTKQSTTSFVCMYYIFINCSWVVTRWQYTFTHKQYIEQHK